MSFEYQVILLATKLANAKLEPIDEDLPHSMLPVCNRPLISYQLELLEKAGFHSVLVVINEFDQSKIRPFVLEIYKGKIEVEFFVLKDQIGTGEILYRIRDKIKTPNFIVMNGNLIADEGFVRKMADSHRSNDASFTVLLNPPPAAPTQPTKSESIDTSFVDYIALDENAQRILFMERATEIEDDIPISKSLLKHFPNLVFNNNLQDAQFYIFSRWVIDLIAEDQKSKNIQFVSIKNHLIPYLLSCQVPGHGNHLPATALNYLHDLGLSMSSSASPFNPSYHINQSTTGTIKCLAYLMPRDGYCANINNLQSYRAVNNDIARGASSSIKPHEPRGKNNYVDPTVQVAPTSVGADCVIGMATVLGAKSSVKKSIIGKHCKFGLSVRIENAIIMDHVTVEDGCSINGSIIGNNVYIKTKLAVKDSQVASGYTVKKELKSKAVGNELE
ncbi:eukaryotic translation initiation factor 2B [Cavenderia fasciculata]|uniref:Translation initiation factor eIF2B subunit gamma n=1 Tax=Cavenderia fasciculata TaxID=261658 RepID=F4QEB4_CACFS|nr:eukaryotic translation initiation factor 2B [Cavenderia fasciculata]EGG14061.1 eukaryotic translation initiation factor 2B [Cavenderia fasciculata]|eukprot:XP_004350769.1 eukaryotic translation initiation factor 2B [Cavenderia fasciculata]